jgi:hypothetical protein
MAKKPMKQKPHDDVAQDTALIKKLLKKEGRQEKKCGGKVKRGK